MTLAVERRVNQASESLWNEAWMYAYRRRATAEFATAVASGTRNDPDEVKTEIEPSNIAAKREPVLLELSKEDGYFSHVH